METVQDVTRTKEGVTITLPSTFIEYESEKWESYYESDDYAFMAKRVLRSKYDESLTSKAYLQYILSEHKLEATVGTVEGINEAFHYCYYVNYENDEPTFGYMMLVIGSEDYFYLMNFSSVYEKFQDSKLLFLQYALTIKVK